MQNSIEFPLPTDRRSNLLIQFMYCAYLIVLASQADWGHLVGSIWQLAELPYESLGLLQAICLYDQLCKFPVASGLKFPVCEGQ